MPEKELKFFDPTIPIEQADTPPYTWYTDQSFYNDEVSNVFEKCWLPVGRIEQLRNTGDYFTGEITGNPYVVLKDGEQLRGFHNVCRHKAATIAQGCGNSACLVCPYHGWTYDLDGQLKKAPHMGKMEHFDVNQHGLKKFPVQTWGPFVFADLDGYWGHEENYRDLQKDLEPIRKPLEELHLSDMKWVERRIYTMNCNWKVFVENSLDGGYHVGYIHDDSLASGLDFEGYHTEVFDRTSIQTCCTKNHDARLGSKVCYAYLFPNFFVNIYGNMMDTNIVIPLGVDSCQVIFDFYFNFPNLIESNVQKFIERSIAKSEAVQKEDIRVCESVQRGLHSMSYAFGRYSSKLEKAAHAFHYILWKELSGRVGKV